jgi:hypothetical protein
VLLTCFLAFALTAAAESATVYVQVILGTDQNKPNGTNWLEVGPKLSAKLSPVFRWKHYWETERKKVEFNPDKVAKVPLGSNRTLEVERTKTGDFEVRLTRRTGLVTKARQSSKDCMAILGGEESTKESFFVVVRRDEPSNSRE